MNNDYVCVREVGLRDGLQHITVPFPTEAKIEWLRIEAAAGIPRSRCVPSFRAKSCRSLPIAQR